MPRYLLDTDICSYIIRRSHPDLNRRLRSLPVGEQAISVVSKAELLFGVSISPRLEEQRAAVSGFLLHVEVLPIEDGATQHYAEIRAELRARGEMIGANDLWIAAHARSLDLTLVTNNVREFRRVSGLRIENWASVP